MAFGVTAELNGSSRNLRSPWGARITLEGARDSFGQMTVRTATHSTIRYRQIKHLNTELLFFGTRPQYRFSMQDAVNG